MKRQAKVQFVILVSVLFGMLVSCSRNQHVEELQYLDSLMETHPEAVYDSLVRLGKQVDSYREKGVSMKYRMLMAKVQNKLYLKMPSDSVFQDVVSYYDSKGTPNERMLAHYLLGCIYRDQEEAPMAIKCYNEAVECADTLSKDCDYITLYSIFGQMSEVYASQVLYAEAVKADSLYSKYALKSGDKYNYIRGLELQIPLYFVMGDTIKAMSQTELCAKLYLQNGMAKAAESVYPAMIDIFVEKQALSKAKYYMDRYEKKSGLFDANLNIQPDREIYYDIKGRYYLAVNNVDSAEYFFRKLSNTTYQYELARGLLAVFCKRMETDSIRKYSAMLDEESDQILRKTRTDAVLKSNSLYNYSRLMRKVLEEKVKTKLVEALCSLAFVVLSLIIILTFLKYRKNQETRKNEILKLSKEFRQAHVELNQANKELETVRSNRECAIRQLEGKIQKLQSKVTGYQLRYDSMKNAEKEMALKENAIVIDFKEMASPKMNISKPQKGDWEALSSLFRDLLPLLNARIVENNSLGPQEYKVCMLTRLGFTNGEMQILLNTSSQSITNTKAKVNKKLFGQDGATTLYKNLIDV